MEYYDNTVNIKNKEGYILLDEKRVFVHRMFPHEELTKYISVQDSDKKEIGIIRDIYDLSPESREAVLSELKRKYFIRIIKEIVKIKDRYGFTYWTVVTEGFGKLEFTLQDTYRSITRIDAGRVMITDTDGNLYEIPSIEALEKKSFRLIEIYL